MKAVMLIHLMAISSTFCLAQRHEDTISVFRSVVIEAGESAADVVCFFCSAQIHGEISGDVVTIGGDIEINGSVDGDVVAGGGRVILGAEGRVGGDLVAVGGTVSGPGAKTHGEAASFPYLHFPGQRSFDPRGLLTLVGLSGLMVGLGVLVGDTRAEWVRRKSCRRWWLSLFLGLVGWAALVALLALDPYSPVSTILGWTFPVLLLLTLLFGFLTVAWLVGRGVWKAGGGKAWLLGTFVLTALVLTPILGGAVLILLWLLGLGGSLRLLIPSRSRSQLL